MTFLQYHIKVKKQATNNRITYKINKAIVLKLKSKQTSMKTLLILLPIVMSIIKFD